MATTLPVTSVWSGPGATDGVIETAPLHEDAWHPSAHRQAFEHWYFDARLDDGHVVLAFLQFAKPGDMKPGVELQVYKPDGSRLEVRQSYPRSAIQASMQTCEVQVAHNRAWVDASGALPVFHVAMEEGGVSFDLEFASELPAWQPGAGRTRYGDSDFFAWMVGAPRARVSGTIRYDDTDFDAAGVGYHDHNWGIGPMQRIIDHWHWGRVYSDELTYVYADVHTTKRYGGVKSSPIMLAVGEEIVLSSGEVEVEEGPQRFDAEANRSFPTHLVLRTAESELRLDVERVLHAHDILDDLPVARSSLVKPLIHRTLGRPGYFRFESRYSLRATVDGKRHEATGTTLHEMVALR